MIFTTYLLLIGGLAAPHPTPPVRTDTAPARAASDSVKLPVETMARVTFDFGGGAVAPLLVQEFEAGFAPTATGPNAANASGTRMRFVKAPDGLTPELARHGASAERIPSVLIEVMAGDKPVMTLRLGDVLVASDRIAIDDGAAALEQQRLALVDGIAQLGADLQEAQRQLAVTDGLDKKKLSSALEVARARDRTELLETKLGVQRKRLSLLDRQIAEHLAVKEEITLVVPRFEIETTAGVKTAWSGKH